MIGQRKTKTKKVVSFPQLPHPFPSENPYNIIISIQNIFRALLEIP